jgi:hypothetical protein
MYCWVPGQEHLVLQYKQVSQEEVKELIHNYVLLIVFVVNGITSGDWNGDNIMDVAVSLYGGDQIVSFIGDGLDFVFSLMCNQNNNYQQEVETLFNLELPLPLERNHGRSEALIWTM